MNRPYSKSSLTEKMCSFYKKILKNFEHLWIKDLSKIYSNRIRFRKNSNKVNDSYWMEKAIILGEKARLLSPPNPWVGAIIVNDDIAVGEGFTDKCGGHHAEINAIKMAGVKTINSTLYTSLEPCCHYGRTPPCTKAIIEAKISRVVIALKDPDLKVCGKGIEDLLKANIEVEVGILENQAFLSLEPYLYHRATKKPFVIAKAAVSVDGRIAASDGSSKWISNAVARHDVHQLRLLSDAILVGTNTALNDEPKLNVREIEAKRQPLRILFDAYGKVKPKNSPLFDQTIAKTLIFTSSHCAKDTLDEWQDIGIEVKTITFKDGKLNIEEALKFLGERGIIQLLLEGGGSLFGSFLKESAINQLILYTSPIILGNQGKPLFDNFFVDTMSSALNLKFINAKELDGCIRIKYQL